MPVQEPLPQRKLEIKSEILEPHELERKRKEELLAKVRTIREGWLFNRSALKNTDPKKEYVWVNQDQDRIVWFEGMDYQVVKSKVEHDPISGKLKVVSGVSTKWVREDGTHRRGDLILYEIDKELKEALDVDSDLRAVDSLEGSRDSFRAFAEREKVPYSEGKK